MYLQEILEVVIGLIFMWLLLSIAVMSFQEWISTWLKWRSKELEHTIREMLTNKRLAKQLYAHPLIAGLSQIRPGKKLRLPSYISPDKFAVALFDIVMAAGTDDSPIKKTFSDINAELAKLENPEQRKMAKEDWEAIVATVQQLATSQVGQDAVDSLRGRIQAYAENHPELQPVIDETMPQFDAYFKSLIQTPSVMTPTSQELTLRRIRLGLLAIEKTSPHLQDAIAAMIRNAEAHAKQGEEMVSAARTNIETWFNDNMARLSEAYKRKAQFVSFILGAILALLLNIDTIRLATNLWREPTLRQAIVAQVDKFAATTPEPGTQTEAGATINIRDTVTNLQDQLQVLNLPFGWLTESFDTGGRQCALIPLNAGQTFGFYSQDSSGVPVCKRISNFPVDLPGWLSKIAGILMSGAAAAQGAPFWFDVLRKFVGIRTAITSTGEKT